MCEYVGLEVKYVPVSFAYWFSGGKSAYGGALPAVKRSDGSYMKETAPISRYLARHNGLYPTNPREARECDLMVEGLWPVLLGKMNDWNLQIGA